MANLKHLTPYCKRGWNHFHPLRMRFSHFVAPFTPLYRCTLCGGTQTFSRRYHGGRVRRVA